MGVLVPPHHQLVVLEIYRWGVWSPPCHPVVALRMSYCRAPLTMYWWGSLAPRNHPLAALKRRHGGRWAPPTHWVVGRNVDRQSTCPPPLPPPPWWRPLQLGCLRFRAFALRNKL